MEKLKLSPDEQNNVSKYLENVRDIYGLGIIVSTCCICNTVYDVKLGGSVAGFSHGICEDCALNKYLRAE